MKELRSFIHTNQLNIPKGGKGVTKIKLLKSILKCQQSLANNENVEPMNPLFES